MLGVSSVQQPWVVTVVLFFRKIDHSLRGGFSLPAPGSAGREKVTLSADFALAR